MHEAVLDAPYTQDSHINVLQQLSGDPNQLSALSRDPLPFCPREKIQGREEGTQGREKGYALALPQLANTHLRETAFSWRSGC